MGDDHRPGELSDLPLQDQAADAGGQADADGDLASNQALSERRARSVVERLVADYGASRAQLTADGVGYLVPIATNATPEGRTANRRVEAVVLQSGDQ